MSKHKHWAKFIATRNANELSLYFTRQALPAVSISYYSVVIYIIESQSVDKYVKFHAVLDVLSCIM